MAVEIRAPYNVFFDTDGTPLENGYIFIGVDGLNPLSNPRPVFWDRALTIPATNIRTKFGAPSLNGVVGQLFTAVSYSILVQDKHGKTVFSQSSVQFEFSHLLLTQQSGGLNRSALPPPSFNINSIIDSGLYSWTNSATINQPAQSAPANLFLLEVISANVSGILVIQRIHDLTLGPAFFFQRFSTNSGSTWSSWLDATYKNGQTAFVTVGVHNWTVPLGVNTIFVTGAGAGGNGGNGVSNTSGGGGGGSGAWTNRLPLTVINNTTITITISNTVASTLVGGGHNLSFGRGANAVGVTGGAGGIGSGGVSNGFNGANSQGLSGGGGGGLGTSTINHNGGRGPLSGWFIASRGGEGGLNGVIHNFIGEGPGAGSGGGEHNSPGGLGRESCIIIEW